MSSPTSLESATKAEYSTNKPQAQRKKTVNESHPLTRSQTRWLEQKIKTRIVQGKNEEGVLFHSRQEEIDKTTLTPPHEKRQATKSSPKKEKNEERHDTFHRRKKKKNHNETMRKAQQQSNVIKTCSKLSGSRCLARRRPACSSPRSANGSSPIPSRPSARRPATSPSAPPSPP